MSSPLKNISTQALVMEALSRPGWTTAEVCTAAGQPNTEALLAAAKWADELIDINEVSAMTHKPVATLRWYRATGQGPRSGKLGRRVVYRRGDVNAWIKRELEATAR